MHWFLALTVLSSFRVDTGPYAGAYRAAPGGAINWYFATTSLLRVRRLPIVETRAYLNVYLAHVNPTLGIDDILPESDGTYKPAASDSDDAYAATLLSLAVRYRNESGDHAWWHDHVATLSAIAYAKLLTQVKRNGLIRASASDATGYLMDNVEDYAGLRAFATTLRVTGNSEAAYFAAFVPPLGDAIDRLFDTSAGMFRWSDSDPIGPLHPYPACIGQIFPQMGDVTSGDHALDLRQRSHARAAIARCSIRLRDSPHEAFQYALFIAGLHDPTSQERSVLRSARCAAFARDDIVTSSFRDALRSHVCSVRKER